jgi:uncharacterized membrane protein
MKRITAFLKATTLGGLFVLLPVIVIFVLLAKAVVTTRSGALAVMEKITGQESMADEFPVIYAVLILVVVSFLLGLIMISRSGKSVCTWIERTLLLRIPGYAAARAIIGGMANAEREGVVKAGLLTTEAGMESFVFVTEDHGNGKLTIFIPETPNPGAGSVHIVSKELVRLLNVRITDITTALQQWGVGSARTLDKHENCWNGRIDTGKATSAQES